jgi:hypothetical protein
MSGIIYKITCNDTNKCYVGSTTQSLQQRIGTHVSKCKNWKAGKSSFKSSYEIIKDNNFKGEILEAVNFGEDKKQLLLKEREWIDKLNPVNFIRPIVLNKEEEYKFRKDYREKNKQKISESKKEHYEKNRDNILERRREKYKIEENAEKIKCQNTESYNRNKDKRSKTGKEKIMCEICNMEITRSSKSNHMKSQRHINNI